MGFSQRLIDITFTLGQGTFGTSGQNTVKLAGARVETSISKAGGSAMGSASIRVYGMTLSQMNQLSMLGRRITLYRKNTVTIEVGENVTAPIFAQPGGTTAAPDQTAQSQRTTVFVGTIIDAYMDASSAPDVAFVVEARTGLWDQITPQKATSIKGQAKVADMISSLSTVMGRRFINDGVNLTISNPYFEGSPLEQVKAICKAAPCALDDTGTKIQIWPWGQAKNGSAVDVSPANGLIGYPTPASKGVAFRSLFNPSITFGGKINIRSSIDPANGIWIVYKLDYQLAAQVPRGPWFLSAEACREGSFVWG